MKLFVCLPALLLATTPAAAQSIVSTAPSADSQSVIVSYDDLNLASDSGMERLDRRLRAAARTVCDVRSDREPITRKIAVSRCFNDALARGREDGRRMIAAWQSGNTLAAATTIVIARQ